MFVLATEGSVTLRESTFTKTLGLSVASPPLSECNNKEKLCPLLSGMGGAVAQSVERTTLGEEVMGSSPAVTALSLLVGSVSVRCDQLRQKS